MLHLLDDYVFLTFIILFFFFFCFIFVHLRCILSGEYLTYSWHPLLLFLQYSFDSTQGRHINDSYLLISLNGSLGDFVSILSLSKSLDNIYKCIYAYLYKGLLEIKKISYKAPKIYVPMKSVRRFCHQLR